MIKDTFEEEHPTQIDIAKLAGSVNMMNGLVMSHFRQFRGTSSYSRPLSSRQHNLKNFCMIDLTSNYYQLNRPE